MAPGEDLAAQMMKLSRVGKVPRCEDPGVTFGGVWSNHVTRHGVQIQTRIKLIDLPEDQAYLVSSLHQLSHVDYIRLDYIKLSKLLVLL